MLIRHNCRVKCPNNLYMSLRPTQLDGMNIIICRAFGRVATQIRFDRIGNQFRIWSVFPNGRADVNISELHNLAEGIIA